MMSAAHYWTRLFNTLVDWLDRKNMCATMRLIVKHFLTKDKYPREWQSEVGSPVLRLTADNIYIAPWVSRRLESRRTKTDTRNNYKPQHSDV